MSFPKFAWLFFAASLLSVVALPLVPIIALVLFTRWMCQAHARQEAAAAAAQRRYVAGLHADIALGNKL